MELWEFAICIEAYNRREQARLKADAEARAVEYTALAWQIGNFTGVAMAGKLKKLKHYLKPGATEAPSVSKEEFDKLLERGDPDGA